MGSWFIRQGDSKMSQCKEELMHQYLLTCNHTELEQNHWKEVENPLYDHEVYEQFGNEAAKGVDEAFIQKGTVYGSFVCVGHRIMSNVLHSTHYGTVPSILHILLHEIRGYKFLSEKAWNQSYDNDY